MHGVTNRKHAGNCRKWQKDKEGKYHRMYSQSSSVPSMNHAVAVRLGMGSREGFEAVVSWSGKEGLVNALP